MAVRTGPVELVDLATDAAEKAADLLLDGLGRARATVETKSTATDMVSEMDRASEELIVSTLLAARPDDGVVGEEGSDSPGTSGLRWVIDPLDGTTNYLYGHPGWAVSIAAEDDAGVVASVVIDPMHGDVFTGSRGGGARRNGRVIACSRLDDVSTALVATGFGYAADRRRAQAEVLVELLPRIRDIRRMGAAAVDLCSVACGRVDAYFERGWRGGIWRRAAWSPPRPARSCPPSMGDPRGRTRGRSWPPVPGCLPRCVNCSALWAPMMCRESLRCQVVTGSQWSCAPRRHDPWASSLRCPPQPQGRPRGPPPPEATPPTP
jgi:myo-inositol-1(or 4)-monophosphatase